MSSGVIIHHAELLMNPGPYWPLYLWELVCNLCGPLVGGDQRTALCQGGVLAARWSPASLAVRYGPERQHKTWYLRGGALVAGGGRVGFVGGGLF